MELLKHQVISFKGLILVKYLKNSELSITLGDTHGALMSDRYSNRTTETSSEGSIYYLYLLSVVN